MQVLGVLIVSSLLAAGSGLECYTCSSSSDLDCARKPGKQIEVQECEGDTECVTTIISGVTHRGCLSSVLPSKVCTTLCEKCTTSLCNVKIYPEDRLRCFQCLGSTCIDIENSTTLTPLPCPIYKESDRCYTNIISVDNVQRGCEATDLSTATGCTNICLKCNYDGCNNVAGISHHYCLQCSHTSASPDYGCYRGQESSTDQCSVTDTKSCYNKVLLGHRGKCFTYINEQTNVVNRGCSSAMGFYPTGNLTECYGENCNDDCLDITCNECDTITNPSCRNQTSVLKATKCITGTKSCFSCEEGTYLWRGCGSTNLQPKANQVCYQCRGANGCNRQSIRTCYKCSSLNDKNCATWADISNLTAVNCTHAEEKCVSTLVSRLSTVYTLRGCASQVPECTESDPFCDRCEGSLCNRGAKDWSIEPRGKKYLTWLRYYRMQRSAVGHLELSSSFWYLLACVWIIRLFNRSGK